MTPLPGDETFMIRRPGESRPRSEFAFEWTLEKLHRYLVDNRIKDLYLERLMKSRNQNPRVYATILDGIRQNSSIENLFLDTESNGFTDEMQLEVLAAIASLPNLKSLSWGYTQSSTRVCQELSNYVASSQLVSYANYQSDVFPRPFSEERRIAWADANAAFLADSIRDNHTLRSLRVCFPLTAIGLSNLLDAVVDSGTVEELTFSENGGHAYLPILKEALTLCRHTDNNNNSRLQKIDFGTDEREPETSINALCALVKAHPQLVEISLEMSSCQDPLVNMELDWNRYGRPLLGIQDEYEAEAAIFEAIAKVNNESRPRLDQFKIENDVEDEEAAYESSSEESEGEHSGLLEDDGGDEGFDDTAFNNRRESEEVSDDDADEESDLEDHEHDPDDGFDDDDDDALFNTLRQGFAGAEDNEEEPDDDFDDDGDDDALINNHLEFGGGAEDNNDDDDDDDDDDDRPALNRTNITYRILQEAYLPRFFYGSQNN